MASPDMTQAMEYNRDLCRKRLIDEAFRTGDLPLVQWLVQHEFVTGKADVPAWVMESMTTFPREFQEWCIVNIFAPRYRLARLTLSKAFMLGENWIFQYLWDQREKPRTDMDFARYARIACNFDASKDTQFVASIKLLKSMGASFSAFLLTENDLAYQSSISDLAEQKLYYRIQQLGEVFGPSANTFGVALGMCLCTAIKNSDLAGVEWVRSETDFMVFLMDVTAVEVRISLNGTTQMVTSPLAGSEFLKSVLDGNNIDVARTVWQGFKLDDTRLYWKSWRRHHERRFVDMARGRAFSHQMYWFLRDDVGFSGNTATDEIYRR